MPLTPGRCCGCKGGWPGGCICEAAYGDALDGGGPAPPGVPPFIDPGGRMPAADDMLRDGGPVWACAPTGRSGGGPPG